MLLRVTQANFSQEGLEMCAPPTTFASTLKRTMVALRIPCRLCISFWPRLFPTRCAVPKVASRWTVTIQFSDSGDKSPFRSAELDDALA